VGPTPASGLAQRHILPLHIAVSDNASIRAGIKKAIRIARMPGKEQTLPFIRQGVHLFHRRDAGPANPRATDVHYQCIVHKPLTAQSGEGLALPGDRPTQDRPETAREVCSVGPDTRKTSRNQRMLARFLP
tara:strand:+ start:2783 stop:3175 length:393 start_codon:yes stop_codon:yes gene_type:complete